MRKSALLLTLGLCTAVQTSAQHPQQHRMMLPTQNIDFYFDCQYDSDTCDTPNPLP